jgi:hypothetical protein
VNGMARRTKSKIVVETGQKLRANSISSAGQPFQAILDGGEHGVMLVAGWDAPTRFNGCYRLKLMAVEWEKAGISLGECLGKIETF